MKRRFLFFVVIAFFVLTGLFGQQVLRSLIQPEHINVTLTATQTRKIYYVFPPPEGADNANRTSPSTSSPSSTTGQATTERFSSSGNVGVSMYLVKGTVEESDSLGSYIKPLYYDPTTGWYESSKDSTFLKWDSPDWYTASSITYLNWTTAKGYNISLGGELWEAAGFVLYLVQVAHNNAGASATARVTFWNRY